MNALIPPLLEHLRLSGAAFILSVALGFALGLVAVRGSRLGAVLTQFATLARTLPSLAVLALALPLLGTGFVPSLLALTLYATAPVLLAVVAGLQLVDPSLREIATGLGLTARQRLARVEFPLAAPIVVAGLRVAAIEIVAGATLATFIGGGGLGDLIARGLAVRDTGQILLGALPVVALALLIEAGLGRVERRLAGGGA
jgi:osmoprotectant transport system permease protein